MSEQPEQFQDISPAENKPNDGGDKKPDRQWKTIDYFRWVVKTLSGRVAEIKRSIFAGGEAGGAGNNEGKGKRKKKDDKPPVSMSRRKFLIDASKWGALAIVGTALEIYGLKYALEKFGKDKVEEVLKQPGWSQDEEGRLVYNPPSEVKEGYYEELEKEERQQKEQREFQKQKEMKEREVKVLRDIFIEQLLAETGEIELNTDTKEQIEAYWENTHSEGGTEHFGLKQSLNRMKEWYSEVKREFLTAYNEEELFKYGVDKKTFLEFIYLAIPESYCRQVAGSSAGAVGWYQLVKGTATGKNKKGQQVEKGLGLVVDKNIDERYDILANAHGAALYLARLYKKYRIENNTSRKDAWKLTLARYNGGKYIRNFKGNTYEEFLEIREKKLNEYIAKVLQQGYFENYKVRKIYDKKKGQKRFETWEEIANRLGVNLEELKYLNRGIKTIKKGGRLNIPIFRSAFEYEVVAGDRLEKIAQKYEISIEQIMKDNEMNNSNLMTGQKLQININDERGIKMNKSLELLFKVDLHSALENLNYPEKFFAILKVLKRDDLLIKETDDKIEKNYKTGLELKKKFKRAVSLAEVSLKLNIKLWALKSINKHILNTRKRIPEDVKVYVPDFIDLDVPLKISATQGKIKKISPRRHKKKR